jgi:uncharacterized damage-inducible protein DinB
MFQQNLSIILQRDLRNLKKELESYQNESNLWLSGEGISNSAGNLALHLIGNLNHFIGALLGNTGYLREREKEFSNKNIPLQKITQDIDLTISMLSEVLPKLTEEQLKSEFPYRLQDQAWPTEAFLLHLVAHLNYHLGQINYHRRLLDK